MNFSLSPFAPNTLVSRERFGCPVPRWTAELGAYSRGLLSLLRRRCLIYTKCIYCHRDIGVSPDFIRSRNYIMAFVHRRESADTGPAVIIVKAAALFR